jgi:hypothetical protein
VADRTDELRGWWTSLDADERAHAFRCVEAGLGDEWLTRSLRSAGIAVVVNVSDGVDPWMPHIPRDVGSFVAGQPHGRSASGRLLFRKDPGPA